ncbi:hypothetical protein EWI61_10985 [Methylolobus aquaticus]|nr:hypothetical protein EWI61_10985 [Methylolobus aquaticus]
MNFASGVVIGTGTLFGTVLRPGSPPRRALLAALSRATVCVSSATLAELEPGLIASDEDLRVLNPWNGIAIQTPAQFLS